MYQALLPKKVLLLILLVTAVELSGCSKEEENGPEREGAVTFEGKTYDTQYGYSFTDITDAGDYAVFLELTNLDYSFSGNIPETTNTVYFNVYGMPEARLEAGTYPYERIRKDGRQVQANVPGFVGLAGFDFDVDFVDMQTGTKLVFETGTVTVEKDGEYYTIDYTFTTAQGETVTGFYKGSLEALD